MSGGCPETVSGPDSKTVLVIGGDARLRKMLKDVLRNLGHTDIDESGDPAKALRLDLIDRTYGLIVVHQEMAPMDGAEFAHFLRNAWSGKSRTTPVLMVTSAPSEDSIKAAVAAGTNDIIAIPFTQRDFEGKVASIFTKLEHAGAGGRR